MSRQQRLRQLGTGLLYALIAAGVVLAGAGAAVGQPLLFAAGGWFVTLALIVRLLRSRAPPR
jgi:hypothetical protein